MFSMTALRATLALLAVSAFSLSAAASTVQETSVSGGDYSGEWQKPTVIGFGSDSIVGTWSQGNDYDILALTGLTKGAQDITLTFSPITGTTYSDSFSAGGNVFWKTSPLQYSGWEGTPLGSIGIQKEKFYTPQTLTLSLDSSFGGELYLQLYGTYGSLQYNISAPGNASLASKPTIASAVPLPAGIFLMFGGLAVLGGVAATRRRKA
ncbi:hypothetical protein P775_14710 [Puniceibacterium antarcticum]|uniref:VPLPA-CTERM protein sorting domain-containing protein n=2 Tax=Puniceibacterium antarcticum TaxID=1206336 RepID=A0A2G8RCY1_9RHOB|nr:hypothetical protein P775_14710 [Puniceibacterium antarcticum]